MIHGQRTSDQASKSFERGSRTTAFGKYHGRDTGSKLKNICFMLIFYSVIMEALKAILAISFVKTRPEITPYIFTATTAIRKIVSFFAIIFFLTGFF